MNDFLLVNFKNFIIMFLKLSGKNSIINKNYHLVISFISGVKVVQEGMSLSERGMGKLEKFDHWSSAPFYS